MIRKSLAVCVFFASLSCWATTPIVKIVATKTLLAQSTDDQRVVLFSVTSTGEYRVSEYMSGRSNSVPVESDVAWKDDERVEQTGTNNYPAMADLGTGTVYQFNTVAIRAVANSDISFNLCNGTTGCSGRTMTGSYDVYWVVEQLDPSSNSNEVQTQQALDLTGQTSETTSNTLVSLPSSDDTYRITIVGWGDFQTSVGNPIDWTLTWTDENRAESGTTKIGQNCNGCHPLSVGTAISSWSTIVIRGKASSQPVFKTSCVGTQTSGTWNMVVIVEEIGTGVSSNGNPTVASSVTSNHSTDISPTTIYTVPANCNICVYRVTEYLEATSAQDTVSTIITWTDDQGVVHSDAAGTPEESLLATGDSATANIFGISPVDQTTTTPIKYSNCVGSDTCVGNTETGDYDAIITVEQLQ